MSLSRLEALKLLNSIVPKLVPDALDGLSLDTSKICVWAVYRNRHDDARALLAKRALHVTNDEVVEIGTFWIKVWQLGTQETKHPCPLCTAMLPPYTEILCFCFERARIGKYVEYDVPGVIHEIAQEYPDTWHLRSAEAYVCRSCSRVRDVPLGKIAARFNQGKSWLTPIYCPQCRYHFFQKNNMPKSTDTYPNDNNK